MNGGLRRPKFRQCIYCLGEFPRAQITDDHIIAGSWYPDTTPSTVQRWTAPACTSCNNRYSPIERYVHARLAACIDPTHPAAAGMWEKAKSSIDPKRARNRRDREHRIRQRNAFWSGLTELRQPPAHTLPFPNSSVGLNRKNTLVRGSFSTEFQKHLTRLNDWFDYLEGFRHALAHRIPLYIPPYVVSKDKDAAYRSLENRMSEADFTEYERLSAEQKALATFIPCMTHSFEEEAKPIVFHSQMLIDFLTVEELAKKMLGELDP